MNPKPTVYRFDDFTVDPAGFRLSRGRRHLTLEPKAFDVLLLLLANHGRLVEKDTIIETVWRDTHVTDNALTRVVAQIRRVLGDDVKNSRYIETVPTRGYRFTGTLAAPHQGGEAIRRAGRARFGLRVVLPLVSALALIAAIALSRWRSDHAGSIVPPAQHAIQLTSSLGLDCHPAFSPDGNLLAYSSDQEGDFEIFIRQLTPQGKEIQLTSDGQQNLQPAWSPDGRLIAYHSRKRGGIWIIPALGGTPHQIADFGSAPAWSPDGKSIAFQSDPLLVLGAASWNSRPGSTLWIASVEGGPPRRLTQAGEPEGGHGKPSWSPDGRRLVFVTQETRKASIWSVSLDGSGRRLITESKWAFDPVYAADGRSIYFTAVFGDSNMGLWRVGMDESGLPAGAPRRIAGGAFRYAAVFGGGEKIAYSSLSLESNLWLLRLSEQTGLPMEAPRPLTRDRGYRNTSPSFSPDGKRIACVVVRSGFKAGIWLIDVESGERRQATLQEDVKEISPSWTDSGLFYVRGLQDVSLVRLDVETGVAEAVFNLAASGDIGSAAVSPDGSRLVFNSTKAGIVNLWTADLSHPSEPRQLTFAPQGLGYAYWSPKGDRLAVELIRGDDTQIGIMASDGGEAVQLTSHPGQAWTGGFSPDGRLVLLAALREGAWNIWWISAQDRTEQRLTEYSKANAFVRYPRWSPKENLIVYEHAETSGNIWLLQTEGPSDE